MGYLGTKPANQITDSTLIADGTITTSDLASGLTVNFADGSASTPSITNDGDTNTGIFFPAADTIAFAEGGAEVARFDSAGDFGIGTNNPSAKLHVFGSGTDANCRVEAPSGTNRYLDYGVGSSGHYVYGYGNYPLYFGTNGTERMRIDTSGRLLLNTSSAFAAGQNIQIGDAGNLDIGTSYRVFTNGNWAIAFNNTSTSVVGQIVVNSGSVAYNTTSDYRLKENVAPMTGALAKVQALKPCTYTWKADGSDGQGFIAHELAEVCPDAVTGEKDDVYADGKIKPQSIDTSFLVATLTAAIQELNAKVDSLQAELATLKGQA